METDDVTIQTLVSQERALAEEILQLEAAADASSTLGIREFRRTRLRQLEDQRLALGDRLRRIESGPLPCVEAHMLGTALKEATLVAQGTFGR